MKLTCQVEIDELRGDLQSMKDERDLYKSAFELLHEKAVILARKVRDIYPEAPMNDFVDVDEDYWLDKAMDEISGWRTDES